MKKKRRLKKWVKVVLLVLFISIMILLTIKTDRKEITKKTTQKQNIVEKKKIYTKELIEIPQQVEQEVKKEETKQEKKKVEQKQEEVKQEVQTQSSYTTRMTSYYPQESSDCTGSGLCSWDFQTNDKGWYIYNGKLVVATATTYLLKEGFSLADGVHTYKYYDEITLNIDGVDYQAIVLDSCGSSMRTDRIDLFVSNANSIKDTMIEVR